LSAIPFPFRFSSSTLAQRRHGPSGYRDYRTYKPWLRDEHDFRCVYCLQRELWSSESAAAFGVDHIEPKSVHPVMQTTYSNLCYCCNRCNSRKSQSSLPARAASEPLGTHLEFNHEGNVAARTTIGSYLIDLFCLDDDAYVEWRNLILELYADALKEDAQGRPGLKARRFGFPDDLPDLRSTRVPSNHRPEGIEESAYARRERGELPDYLG